MFDELKCNRQRTGYELYLVTSNLWNQQRNGYKRSPFTNNKVKNIFNVLYRSTGTKESLYDAWDVSLKSVLVNAPVDASMEMHVTCSQEACAFVKKRVKDAELEGSLWRNQITITLYNVEAYNQEWREFPRKKIRREDL